MQCPAAWSPGVHGGWDCGLRSVEDGRPALRVHTGLTPCARLVPCGPFGPFWKCSDSAPCTLQMRLQLLPWDLGKWDGGQGAGPCWGRVKQPVRAMDPDALCRRCLRTDSRPSPSRSHVCPQSVFLVSVFQQDATKTARKPSPNPSPSLLRRSRRQGQLSQAPRSETRR